MHGQLYTTKGTTWLLIPRSQSSSLALICYVMLCRLMSCYVSFEHLWGGIIVWFACGC